MHNDAEPEREEDQARIQEQQGIAEQPEAIASPGGQSPLGIVAPARWVPRRS